MIIVCALLAEEFYGAKIPVVDDLDEDPIKTIRTGDRVRVDGQSGMVEVIREV
jgi:predicted aconitase with swiveling domain